MKISELTREYFVVAFRPKEPPFPPQNYCHACMIGNKVDIGLTHGTCIHFMCASETSFDNTIHIPVVTLKSCMITDTCHGECGRCVMYLKFGLHR